MTRDPHTDARRHRRRRRHRRPRRRPRPGPQGRPGPRPRAAQGVRGGRGRAPDRAELHAHPARVRPARRGPSARRAAREHGHEGRRRRHRADPAGPGGPRAALRLPLPRHPPQRPARHRCCAPAARPASSCSPTRRSSATRTPPAAPASSSRTGAPRRPRSSSPPTGCTRSPARCLVDDEPVSSAYVAYRGAVPIEQVRDHDVSQTDVVVYVGPQLPLRAVPAARRRDVQPGRGLRVAQGAGRRGGLGHARTSSTPPSRRPASRSSRGSR